jgi:hypothetical protein
MKTSIFVLSAIALSLAGADAQVPVMGRHFLFKASALFPVQIEKPDPNHPGGTILTKVSLGTKEMVNLALARPFNTPLNAKTEVLAVDVNDFVHDKTTVVVYRPDSGLIFPICVLSVGGTPSVMMSNNPNTIKEKGAGLGPGTIVATDASFPQADRDKNSLQSTDICASSTASFGPGPRAPIFTLSATGVIGDVKAKLTAIGETTTTDLDGLIVKGMVSASGQAIKTYFEP